MIQHTIAFLQIMGFLSLAIVVISTITFVIQTIPELGEDPEYPEVVMVLEAIDTISVVFFTIEYFTR